MKARIVPPGHGGVRTGFGDGGVTGPFILRRTARYDEAGGDTFSGQHMFASGTGPVGTGSATSGGNEIFVNVATVTYAVPNTVGLKLVSCKVATRVASSEREQFSEQHAGGGHA